MLPWNMCQQSWDVLPMLSVHFFSNTQFKIHDKSFKAIISYTITLIFKICSMFYNHLSKHYILQSSLRKLIILGARINMFLRSWKEIIPSVIKSGNGSLWHSLLQNIKSQFPKVSWKQHASVMGSGGVKADISYTGPVSLHFIPTIILLSYRLYIWF